MVHNGATQVTVVGNLTDDPELRFTPSGAPVARFTVAVNRRTFNREAGEWQDSGADFHRVSVWRGLAENVTETLTKGMRVVVVGDLRSRSWTDDKTQEKRYAWELEASAVGPELSFATARVTKTSRTSGAAPGDEKWENATRTRPAAAPGRSA